MTDKLLCILIVLIIIALDTIAILHGNAGIYFLLNKIEIVVLAAWIAARLSLLDKKIDCQNATIIDKVIKMFKKAFNIINNNKNLF